MKALKDIIPNLTDARSGYWAIKLTEKSSHLTTFNTPFGRYRFLRMPFGIRFAQDEFQRKIDEIYEGLQGVITLVDDNLVYGKTCEEHDANLRNFLTRSREKGVKLNSDRLAVGRTEVPYFGHILSSDGLKPDPEKIAAICDMELPRNRKELKTVLGMINYLAKFSPNLSEITHPMRQLLQNTFEFIWDEPQASAFQKVKKILTRSPGPVLAYYDPKKPVTLQVDESKYGLGVV